MLGNQDILAVALVLGGHQPDAAFLQQSPDDGIGRTLDDLGDAALGSALAVMSHHACLDTVFVQHSPHFVGGQINIRLRIVALHEAMAVTVAEDRAFEFSQQGRCGAAGGMYRLDGFSLMSWTCQQGWDCGPSGKFQRLAPNPLPAMVHCRPLPRWRNW